MGRGVNYLNNAEYVIYFSADWINENGECDEDISCMNWEDFKENLIYEICKKLKSYNKCEKWDSNEVKIFLENELAEIALSEYCGLYSLSIRVKDDNYYNEYHKESLGKYHCQQVRKTLENTLVSCGCEVLNRIATMSNGVGVFEKANV